MVEGFRIGRKLGAGGVGAVYQATAEASGRQVAIKVLHREFSDQRDVTLRFFNEARAVKVVGHPGLVDIQSCGELPDGTAYMIMEYLQGETVQMQLRQGAGRLPLKRVMEVCRQAAETLVATHEKGIIHRG